MSSLDAADRLTQAAAVVSILLGVTTNSVTKLVLAFDSSRPRFAGGGQYWDCAGCGGAVDWSGGLAPLKHGRARSRRLLSSSEVPSFGFQCWTLQASTRCRRLAGPFHLLRTAFELGRSTPRWRAAPRPMRRNFAFRVRNGA
jgi:hypothetical protein